MMSLHVSRNCSSVCKVPVCQSKVETCPIRPTIARCLEHKVVKSYTVFLDKNLPSISGISGSIRAPI